MPRRAASRCVRSGVAPDAGLSNAQMRGRSAPAEFTHDGKGVITSTVFDAKIKNDIPDWWDDTFPAKRDFDVVVNEENGSDEIRWQFEHGKCTSCPLNGEELVEQGGEEDLSVSGGCGTVQFYAKSGAVPDADGKYDTSDYIGVVDDDWLIVPESGEGDGYFFIPVSVDESYLPYLTMMTMMKSSERNSLIFMVPT